MLAARTKFPLILPPSPLSQVDVGQFVANEKRWRNCQAAACRDVMLAHGLSTDRVRPKLMFSAYIPFCLYVLLMFCMLPATVL